MRKWLEAITHWLKRGVTQPREELDRWQAAARFVYDLGRFGARQLRQDRATEMAAALSFRTLFGLLPVFVVATVLVKAMGMEQHYLEPLQRLFENWGLDQVRIVLHSDPSQESVTLAAWLHDRVREAEAVNFAAIGWVGIAVTIYAAISLMVTIEESFNTIYQAMQGRAWSSRVPLYWFALTISPLIIVGSSYVDTWFQKHLDGLEAYGWLAVIVDWLWSGFAFWLLLLAVYRLLPNTHVRLRYAVLGALVGAVLLEVGKRTMGLYLRNALSLSQLYGSLGLIPLFMFWVYLMWLAVLFGLQVGSTLQHLHGRRLEELEQQRKQSALIDPAVVIVVMQWIGRRFQAGRASDLRAVSAAAAVPEAIMERILEVLVAHRLLHRVVEAEACVALARPPEQIPVAELLTIAEELGRHDTEEAGPRTSALLDDLHRAQRAAAADATLASLLEV